MMSNSEFGSISFDLPKNQSNVIKVIGVGGGGSNAINHMFKQGIKGVDFIVCNTDSQALQSSPVPNKIQLGLGLTEGLGAGANPEVGQQAALESINEIEKMLDTNTKMIFITAGMGGGTGTGAAPVIAQLAKERDILTVGIVTIPFQFEGKVRQEQALAGVDRLRRQVDSLIVINNNKLREVYGNLGFKAGFSKADEVLATASKGIAEVITHHYTQNIDLKDAKTVLSNSGTAIMGSAIAAGDSRAKNAIVDALDSPLLNDNKITGAKNVLLLIVSGTTEITIDEIGEINDHIQNEAGHNANIIMGVGEDESLGDGVAVTIIATGFNVEQQNEIVNTEPKKIVHALEDDQKMVHNLTQKALSSFDFSAATEQYKPEVKAEPVVEEKIVFALEEEVAEKKPIAEADTVSTSEHINNLDVFFEIVAPVSERPTPAPVAVAPIAAPAPTPVFEVAPAVQQIPVTQQPIAQQYQAPVIKDVREIEVRDPEFVIVEKAVEDQYAFSFDLSINNVKSEEKLLFNLNDETRNIKVQEPVQVVPVTELNQGGVIRYSLEEYLEKENEFLDAKPVAKVEEPIAEELKFTLRQTPTPQVNQAPVEELSPMEMTIEDTLRQRAEERRRKMKEFNYKFHNNTARIDEFEKEPAYKRMGIDLHDSRVDNSKSRLSLGTDSNDDLQLRSNNSFLHDNVD
ncbi:cell division protein FtsZ [Flavobacterium rivuli WB 3.3-2 = DSM 21788]|uniref:Cell division protein FtsZ n=1 Tax=Flavobacterium rivuli WB 3.3-2 = DSM 21788 TaxID=1121895 RepID=A0A0A2M173_9FLAO|nr:cell division protein FtsZ [Flavobacterium rivuli]KGO86397.1 cell division protein FtsZ [Flavobacterium rivuli WB 3.3-2 = DSM 21788]